MNNLIKSRISKYDNVRDTTSQCCVELDEVLKLIKDSPKELIDRTGELNVAFYTDEEKYKELKKSLPLFCPSGCFSYRDSDPSHLLCYSNILVLDFDWEKPNPVEIENFRQKLIQYATPLHIYAVWKSPAKGVKAVMLHSNTVSAYHTELFIQVKNKLYPNTPQLDMKCKDIARGCFICYDPNLYINTDPNLKEFQFQHDPAYQVPSSATKTSRIYNSSGKFQHTSTEIMLNTLWQQKCSDKTLMNMIIKSCNAANPLYNTDGHRHSEVLRRAVLYCKDGVLFDNAVWSLVGQFGQKSKANLNNDDIESMVNSCYHNARAEFGMERQKFIDKYHGKG